MKIVLCLNVMQEVSPGQVGMPNSRKRPDTPDNEPLPFELPRIGRQVLNDKKGTLQKEQPKGKSKVNRQVPDIDRGTYLDKYIVTTAPKYSVK